MASDGPSPHPHSLRLGPAAQKPSRPTTPSPCWALHLLAQERLMPHPVQAAPLSHRNGERRHAFGSHSALALRRYLAACNPSSNCRFWDLDHLCSNLTASCHSCWIAETRFLNLCFRLFLFCRFFSDRNKLLLWVPVCNLVVITTAIPVLLNLNRVPWQYQKYWTILLLVLCLLRV